MTLVHISLSAPSVTGEVPVVRAALVWQPWIRRLEGDTTVLPLPIRLPLVDGEGEIELEPGFWKVTERIARQAPVNRWVQVPTGATAEYADLVEIDPDTLDDAPPAVAWQSALDTLSVMHVRKSGTWPVRPTASAGVMVVWVGPGSPPPVVSSGVDGMRDNLDVCITTGA